MGKSNNPAKRASPTQETRTKNSKSNKSTGLLKFMIIFVLAIAIMGPFFAGITSM